MNRVPQLLGQLGTYAAARRQLLQVIECSQSCRDPLAEFSERIVLEILSATAAPSRVQRGYDLTCPLGRRVQVKYLANPTPDQWVNEHAVTFTDEIDLYALVIFEQFELVAVLFFPREGMKQVCERLKKRHPNQDRTLQLTQRNCRELLQNIDRFGDVGVSIWTPTRIESFA